MDRSPPGRGSIATLATVLILLVVGVSAVTGVAGAQASTIYVDGGAADPNCPTPSPGHTTIQDAVDAAAPGDTIVVCGGKYDESVMVDKRLTLEANPGSDVTLVNETLPSGATAITVDASADGTVIEGFAATQFTQVVDVGANDTVVRDLVANDSDTGVGVSSGTAAVSNVTVTNVTLDNVTTGIRLASSGSGALSDVNVLRNLVNGSSTGISVNGASSVPLEDVGVRQNLVANASFAGVDVTADTNLTGIRVTRNFFQDNAPYAVRNENKSGILTAWLNHWGDDSGPGSFGATVSDPVTNEPADGAGDNVSVNVNFDPWLGKGACTDPQILNVTERTIELFEEEIRLSELQPTCVWERAGLPLRANDSDAATSVRNLNVFVRTDTADVPANRPRFSVYQQGKNFTLEFGSGDADVSRFAGDETQLLVVRGEEVSTDFEVGIDNETGEGRLSVDAGTVSVIDDTPALDSSGELDYTFEPTSAGDYTFVLVTNDFGDGVEVDGSGDVRVDGGITVVGAESVPVQNANASGSTVDTSSSYPAGSNVSFTLDSNLGDATTNHSVFLYDESAFTDSSVFIEVDGDLSEVLAGGLSGSNVTVERSIHSVNGFIRADVGFSALGFEVAEQDSSGEVDIEPFVDVATSQFGIDDATQTTTANPTVLNASVAVVQSSGPTTDVDLETFSNFSTGTYRWVYVAQRGSNVSSDNGTVELTTPTATPTPGDGGDGGGGGGQPGGGAAGTVEIVDVALLNDTVEAGQSVVVRVDLANYDPAAGRIALALTADGTVVEERTPAVDASSRRTVFLRNRFFEAGTYTIALNGQELGTVTVTAAPTATPGETPTRTPEVTTSPTETAPPTGTATASPAATPTGTASPVPGPSQGPDAPTGTEVITAFLLVLGLLAAVGVVVYVLPT